MISLYDLFRCLKFTLLQSDFSQRPDEVWVTRLEPETEFGSSSRIVELSQGKQSIGAVGNVENVVSAGVKSRLKQLQTAAT